MQFDPHSTSFNFHSGEVILVDKPLGFTSFQVVNHLKYLIKNHPSLMVDGNKVKPKVGHAGTLDPLATGLLVICTGKKTKTIEAIQSQEKEYTGTFFIGATTPCFDREKEIDVTFSVSHITEEIITKTSQLFIGKQQQFPPIYSAIKIEGKRAYELARSGEHAEIKSKEIEIKSFEITKVEMPLVEFKIVCSKGTYIRSIARDFGKALNSGAYLNELRRTRIGEFKVEDAYFPNKLQFARIKTSET